MSATTFARQVKVPIYGTWFCIIVADDQKQAHAAVEKFHRCPMPPPSAYTAARCGYDSDGWASLCLVRGKISHSTLAHELFHATVRLLHFQGLKCDPDNHEAYSFLCGYLTDWTYRMLKKAEAEIK